MSKGRNLSKLLSSPITIAQGGTGAADATSARAALLIPGRNKIINGDCQVVQRASATFTSTQGYGGPDRYVAANSGAGGSFTQAYGTITYNSVALNAVVQTVNTPPTSLTGSNLWLGICQMIEGINCRDLLGKNLTISFLFNTNVTGSYALSLRDGGSGGSQVSCVTKFNAVANTPTRIQYTIDIPPTLTIPNNNTAGMYITIGALNTGSWQASSLDIGVAGNFVTASGTVNWGATAGNFIAVTELQVESGVVATAFERLPYPSNLALCQRYYRTMYVNNTMYQLAGNGYGVTILIPIDMRVAPTITATNTTYNNTTSPGYTMTTLGSIQQAGYATATGTVVAAATLTLNAEL